MNLLITAGNTRIMLDRVRCMTNIFTGRTGAQIAEEAVHRGHTVTLLSSHPETVNHLRDVPQFQVQEYQTYTELAALLEVKLTQQNAPWDSIIHAAAVADYDIAGIYPAANTEVAPLSTTAKISSAHPELWLRMVPTLKLIDRFRKDWGYSGLLVKFKLEVNRTDAELEVIAEQSRLQSQAELMVANTLEEARDWALLGAGQYRKIHRAELPRLLLDKLEALHAHYGA